MRQSTLRGTLAGLLVAALAAATQAELYVNEIFIDPPGSADSNQEYVELRGTPGMSLDNHYLAFLENENTSGDGGNPGQIDFMFDLTDQSLSPTGFLSLRQKGSLYNSVPNNAFNPINTGTGNFWGTTAADNNVGARSSSLYSNDPGKLENSGFTAMLIRVNSGGSAPTLGMNLDGSVDNDNDAATDDHDGLDYPNGVPDLPGNVPAWNIVDSIGVFSEATVPGGKPGEAIYGRTYAPINFGPEIPGQTYTFVENGVETSVVFQPSILPGQTYVGLGYEIELVARWGNSTGQSAADWHITNSTDKSLSGFAGAADGYRQSGHLHDNINDDFVETNQFVPYGANLNNTIGAANYPLNLMQLPWDYNSNGIVDAADYVLWRRTMGSTTNLQADGNGGKKIEEDDYTFWRGRFGYTPGSTGAGSSLVAGVAGVPEPSSWILALLGWGLSLSRRSR